MRTTKKKDYIIYLLFCIETPDRVRFYNDICSYEIKRFDSDLSHPHLRDQKKTRALIYGNETKVD